jgi:hypothetical protein
MLNADMIVIPINTTPPAPAKTWHNLERIRPKAPGDLCDVCVSVILEIPWEYRVYLRQTTMLALPLPED